MLRGANDDDDDDDDNLHRHSFSVSLKYVYSKIAMFEKWKVLFPFSSLCRFLRKNDVQTNGQTLV